ncbi:MAG TPA: Xaa-Pro peptidase family protein [Fimbriimonadaceae bacterium]|nr:Xaa-Pro peptidase family protein [Fimbriimonadaceae bacterium]
MNTYLQRLRDRMAVEGVPALFVSDNLNVQWLTGFTGSSGYAIVTPDEAVFITDSRYTIQAKQEVDGLEVVWFQRPKTFEEFLTENLERLGVKNLAFETSVTYATWKNWTDKISSVEWTASPDLLKPLRMSKTPEEVEKIKEACKVTDACLQHLTRMMQPGVSEYDVQLDLEFFIRRSGAEIAFHPIVVSGENSARPHGQATEKKLEVGDFVTLDLGAKKDGYCSDITRTFVIGEASDRHKEVYGQVLKAQVAAVDALKVGSAAADPDKLAREILDEKGLAKFFGHGLGHGLGRAVHDFGGLGPNSKDTIAAGQVWTIEPGVYIEGFGGVRIEDDVHVTDKGPEILTHFPKELMVLG